MSNERTDNTQRLYVRGLGVGKVPVLMLLTKVDRVEKVGRGLGRLAAIHRSKIGDWDAEPWGFAQKEAADRRMGGAVEGLELIKRGVDNAGNPLVILLETRPQCIRRPAGTIGSPLKQSGLGRHSHHFSLFIL